MNILLIGDSITEAFDTKILSAVLCQHFSDVYCVINKGIYGDNTQGVLNRIEQDIIDTNPDLLFLLIGTNDFALGKNESEIAESIEKIILKVIECCDKNVLSKNYCYITSILPTRMIENRPNKSIAFVNELLFQLSNKYEINYFDLFSVFIDDTYMLKSNFTIDGLHLSPDAYQAWSKTLITLLENNLIHNK